MTGIPGQDYFATTHWSVVLSARQHWTASANEALEKLCQTYWRPLYAYIRRRGYDSHDAQDLTQEFFARVLKKKYLEHVDRAKGKFRSYLLATLKHFLANEWDRSTRLKRGGQFSFVSCEALNAEERYARELSSDMTPEKTFERTWALVLLEKVMGQLKREYRSAGKGQLYDALQGYLTGDPNVAPYAQTAQKLRLGESALKMAVLRLRRRYGEMLRSEISQTVTTQAEIQQEMKSLFSALQ